MYEVQRRAGNGQWVAIGTFHAESDAWAEVSDKLAGMRRRRTTIFHEGHERVTVIDKALKVCEDARAELITPEHVDVMGVQFRVTMA
ncbi:hypothetical protein EMG21_27680 [Klebsiella pneumoniae]|nr:hypothetical protein EMG21_27680 [Klebsiella pneumoniae]